MISLPDAGEPVPEERPVARALDALQRPAARPRLLHLLPPLPGPNSMAQSKTELTFQIFYQFKGTLFIKQLSLVPARPTARSRARARPAPSRSPCGPRARRTR